MMIGYSNLLASEIYRWVDESGKTHFSDTVPKKYRGGALKTAPHQDPSADQRREAEERSI